jgi:hypothetical protein
MTKVSYYKNIFDVVGVEVDLSKILFAIKNGKYHDQVNKHRLGEVDGKKTLPYFTVGGVFSPTRANDNCTSSSGLISVDLDYVVDVNLVKNMLLEVFGDYIYSIFTSLGGKGLCVLIKTPLTYDNMTFKKRYYAIFEAFQFLNNYCKLDELSDLARPRFISDDSDLYLNEKAQIFDKMVEIEHTESVVKEPLPAVDGYLSEEDELAEVVIRYTDSAGAFGSRGTRHDWVLGLARWMCRGGISEDRAISFIKDNYVNNDREGAIWQREVSRCVKSSYRTFSAENGTYRTPKKFDYSNIHQASNIEDAKYNLLMFIEEKKKLANYLESEKKVTKFVVQEIEFLTKLYKLI